MSAAYLVAARRTAVAPRNGAFKAVEAAELGEAPIRAVLFDSGIAPEAIDDVIFGNVLYGGGNPARLAALRAGLPDHVPALTIDSQCCGGLDAIMLAADRIASGGAHAVIAGGVESFSRAPLRARRPRHAGEAPQPYDRPPFAPWPERDPDMIAAAAALAQAFGIRRARQDEFAIASHRKALENPAGPAEIVALAGLSHDAFPRALTQAVCSRLAPLAGDPALGVTRATVAVEADAAAALLVVSEVRGPAAGRQAAFADRRRDPPRRRPRDARCGADRGGREPACGGTNHAGPDCGGGGHGGLCRPGDRLRRGHRRAAVGPQSRWRRAGARPSDRCVRRDSCREDVARNAGGTIRGPRAGRYRRCGRLGSALLATI